MNKIHHFATAIAFSLGLMSPVTVQASSSAKDPEAIEAEARKIINSYRDLGWFSGSVMLAKSGQPIYQASVGLANRELRMLDLGVEGVP